MFYLKNAKFGIITSISGWLTCECSNTVYRFWVPSRTSACTRQFYFPESDNMNILTQNSMPMYVVTEGNDPPQKNMVYNI
jgi:hypothetical protein